MKTVQVDLGETELQEQRYDSRGIDLRRGEQVVVETKWGLGLARVLSTFPVVFGRGSRKPLKHVLRRATAADLANEGRIRLLEVEAKAFCSRSIEDRRLPMVLIDVKASLDRCKVTFYFSAEERIDFRELVKDLAQRFRTRIEMRQIGARDVASKLGDVGPCGRHLCCKSFIKDYEPIAVRMAKDQSLSLNPGKLAGMCGRLKCCLRFEHSMYEELKRGLPKVGSVVEIGEGLGVVKGRDVLAGSVIVQLEDSRQISVRAAELIHIGPPIGAQAPRKDCGGGGGCERGGCAVPGERSRRDS